MNQNTNQSLVYCGNNCTICPKFKDNIYAGCLTDQVFGECLKCEPRSCCRDKQLPNCAFCRQYPCNKINKMYEKWTLHGFGEGAVICRGILDNIRKIVENN